MENTGMAGGYTMRSEKPRFFKARVYSSSYVVYVLVLYVKNIKKRHTDDKEGPLRPQPQIWEETFLLVGASLNHRIDLDGSLVLLINKKGATGCHPAASRRNREAIYLASGSNSLAARTFFSSKWVDKAKADLMFSFHFGSSRLIQQLFVGEKNLLHFLRRNASKISQHNKNKNMNIHSFGSTWVQL